MFAGADVGGELRGVETLRAGSRSALPHGYAGRKVSEPTAQLHPRLDRSSTDGCLSVPPAPSGGSPT